MAKSLPSFRRTSRMGRGLVFVPMAGAFLFSCLSAQGQTTWTNPGSGNWDVAENWSGGIPNSADTAVINNSGTALLPTGVSAAYGNMRIGVTEGGDGTIAVDGGSLTSGGDMYLGWAEGANGVLTISSGGLLDLSYIWVGRDGHGGMVLDGNGLVQADMILVGANAGSTGGITMNSGTIAIQSSSGGLHIGDLGTGSVMLTGGLLNVGSGDFVLGQYGSGRGAVTVTGGTLSAGPINGIEIMNGTFRVYGGHVQSYDRTYVGKDGSSAGLEIMGGVYASNGLLYAGSGSSSGSIAVYGDEENRGVLRVGAGVQKGNGNGALIIDGGVLQATMDNSDLISGFSQIGIGFNGAFIDTDIYAVTIHDPFAGTGGLTKQGGGFFALTGSSSYAGETVIEQGALAVRGDISTSGSVTVRNGAALHGDGVVPDVTVESGGALAPGVDGDHGALHVEGSLELLPGSTLIMQFSGTGAGEFDEITVGDFFIAGGMLSLQLTDGFTPVEGDWFLLFTSGGYDAGSFSSIATNLGDGLYWDTSTLSTTGIVNVVPEPSTLALLGLAALAGAWMRCRRKA